MVTACLMRSNATPDSKRTALLDKTASYAALSDLNQTVDQILLDLERLKSLCVFRSRFQKESVATCAATIEETRAWINFEATESLHASEVRDRAHFGRIRDRFEKKYEDPYDVLLKAKRLSKKLAPKAEAWLPSPASRRLVMMLFQIFAALQRGAGPDRSPIWGRIGNSLAIRYPTASLTCVRMGSDLSSSTRGFPCGSLFQLTCSKSLISCLHLGLMRSRC